MKEAAVPRQRRCRCSDSAGVLGMVMPLDGEQIRRPGGAGGSLQKADALLPAGPAALGAPRGWGSPRTGEPAGGPLT